MIINKGNVKFGVRDPWARAFPKLPALAWPLGCLVWECPCPGALPYTNSFYSLPNGVQQKKKKNSSWQCSSDSALHWRLLANSNTHPTGEHTSVGRVSKWPLSSTWSQ